VKLIERVPCCTLLLLFALLVVGCDAVNFLSREQRCGILEIGVQTAVYSYPKEDSSEIGRIDSGRTCFILEAELQKNFAWLRIDCREGLRGWVLPHPLNRSYYPRPDS
jgi:hypothetical protein